MLKYVRYQNYVTFQGSRFVVLTVPQELQVWLQVDAVTTLILSGLIAQVTNAALERSIQRDSLALQSLVRK